MAIRENESEYQPWRMKLQYVSEIPPVLSDVQFFAPETTFSSLIADPQEVRASAFFK